MRALLLDAARGLPRVSDVPDPVVPDDGVVIRVAATGLCRSDWHAWAGHDGDIVFPHVPGHELAGIVEAVGSSVTRWHGGERVTVPFVCGCGRCEWCLAGDAQVCPDQQQPGFTHWGSFAELVAIHAADANLVAVPDDVDLATAAALGCRFATAYRALVARARVIPGEWVCVVGAGGVGLSAVMIAKALGARVVVIDRNPEALRIARELGAEHTVLSGAGSTSSFSSSSSSPGLGLDFSFRFESASASAGLGGSPDVDVDVASAVHALTGGGAHVAVDAVGSEQTCADAIHSLRRRGRHVQIGLLPPVGGHPRVPMDRVIGWELDLLGSHGMAAVDYPGMLALIAQGRLEPQRLIERTIGLQEAADLLPRFDTAPVAGITVIDPTR